MPIKFEKDQESVLDARPDGVIVIPVNCQGILEHTVVGARFKTEFPNTYETYMRMVYQDKLKPGECHVIDDGGQRIALLVIANAEFGKFKERDDDVCTAFSNAVEKLFEQTKDLPKYYSGVIKFNNIGKALMNKAKGANIEWIIQKD